MAHRCAPDPRSSAPGRLAGNASYTSDGRCSGLADMVAGIFKSYQPGRWAACCRVSNPAGGRCSPPRSKDSTSLPDSLRVLRKLPEALTAAGYSGDWTVYVPAEAVSGRYGTVSAHAATSVTLAVLACTTIRRRWFSLLMAFCTAAICYSRIYLAKTLPPADILWGILLGMLLGWAAHRALLCLDRKTARGNNCVCALFFFRNFARSNQAINQKRRTYMAIELSEQEQLRRQSLKALRDLGIEPYPAARYEVTATAREIAENYDDTKHNYDDVRIAGRIMSRRIMGSASFFELQDHTGRIQVYIRRDDICPEGDPTLYNTVFKKLLDIGDFMGVEGFRLPHQHRRVVGTLQTLHRAVEVDPPAARRQGEGRQDVRCLHRPGGALPPAVFGPDRQPAGQGRSSSSGRRSWPRCASSSTRTGIHRGRDPDPPAHPRRRIGASVHHPPQLARRRPLPSHRHGALPQKNSS